MEMSNRIARAISHGWPSVLRVCLQDPLQHAELSVYYTDAKAQNFRDQRIYVDVLEWGDTHARANIGALGDENCFHRGHRARIVPVLAEAGRRRIAIEHGKMGSNVIGSGWHDDRISLTWI